MYPSKVESAGLSRFEMHLDCVHRLGSDSFHFLHSVSYDQMEPEPLRVHLKLLW